MEVKMMTHTEMLKQIAYDLHNLAEDIEVMIAEDGSASEQNETDSKGAEKVPEIKLEDVRTVLASKSRDGFGNEVRDLIHAYGADKLSEVDAANYADMMKKAEAIGNAS
jgi:hypothetical protein